MEPRKLFAELKRRNVYKVAIAYAVVAWLLMQIATQFFPFLEIPNWAILLLFIGVPINTWLLLAKLIAQLHRLQRALTPRPIPCLFCDRESQMCCFLRASTTARAILR